MSSLRGLSWGHVCGQLGPTYCVISILLCCKQQQCAYCTQIHLLFLYHAQNDNNHKCQARTLARVGVWRWLTKAKGQSGAICSPHMARWVIGEIIGWWDVGMIRWSESHRDIAGLQLNIWQYKILSWKKPQPKGLFCMGIRARLNGRRI